MFLGEYEHSIDPKGRLALPVKFRNSLGDGAVVTQGLDACLIVYPKKQWEELAEKLATLPMNDPNARSVTRHMFAHAVEVESDKQGRIVIPSKLRQYAGLATAAMVIGLNTKIEIWDKSAWQGYSGETEKDPSAIARQLMDINITL